MSNTYAVPQKAIVFWLSGTTLADLRGIPEVEAFLERSARAELLPSPITGPQAQHYQALSGHSPAYFGFFDMLLPRNYSIVEVESGRGATPKLLPDLLRTVGWTVDYQEVSHLAASVQAWTQSAAASPACLVVKYAVNSPIQDADASSLLQALQLAQAWTGESGLLAVFSDTQPAPVKRYVNVNNFLADMGIIERDEQSGKVNWENSLAYYAGHGQIWVNMLGRDAQGAVHPQDEFEEVRASLAKGLTAKLLDPETGSAALERVYLKEELYSGDYLFCAPDLVAVFKPGYAPSPRSVALEFDEAVFTSAADGTTALAGVHPSTVTGFFAATAATLRAGATVYEPEPLTAVVPTILHALGVEYAGMESAAINWLFEPGYLETHPIRSNQASQELSDEEEELIIGHLRDLGYV